MTLPTHLALGGIIGAVTGQPVLALAVSAFVDVDHLGIYYRHGVLKSPTLFWKTITQTVDPYGGQRGHLHSIFGLVLVAALSWAVLPVYALTLILSHLGHLVLDALDSADYWPLYPFKSINFRGPVGFFSKQEAFVFVVLLFTNAFLWL